MDKAAESFSAILEKEICRWNGFAVALRRDDREAFDSMMTMLRSYTFEASHASNQTTFEPMLICILLAQRKRIEELENKLRHLKCQRNEKSDSKTLGEK
jgi:hypothetical protein